MDVNGEKGLCLHVSTDLGYKCNLPSNDPANGSLLSNVEPERFTTFAMVVPDVQSHNAVVGEDSRFGTYEACTRNPVTVTCNVLHMICRKSKLLLSSSVQKASMAAVVRGVYQNFF